MLKFLFFIVPAFIFGQSKLSKQGETKLYSKAINEYIRSVKTTDPLTIDTLFVGPADKDLEGNLLEVDLPNEILNTKITKLTEVEGQRKAKYRKYFVFVNLIATISKEHAEFLFVTFIVDRSPEKTNWWPKHNFIVDFIYDPKSKEYKFGKQRFEYQYSNKYTKQQ